MIYALFVVGLVLAVLGLVCLCAFKGLLDIDYED